MQRNDGAGKRGEYLLHEDNLRTMLTNMYNAFWPLENSRNVIEKQPDKISDAEYAGDDLTKNSMRGLCEWLSDMSMLTKDDETYRAVFLDPVRIVATMRLDLSRMATSSADTDTLVFAQMPYFDKKFNAPRTIISTVAPGLQAPMSVRVSVDGNATYNHGYHLFESCQPMPLVNRIRQTAGTVRPNERPIDLSEFDYLYAPLGDVASLGQSLEMENFCEVPSTDAKPRQRLAAPFVTFGTVEMVSGPSVHVRSLDGKIHVKTVAEKQVSELSGGPHTDFEHKSVRILGAQWYEPSGKHARIPEDPAIYCIEVDDDLDALRLQEACGRVRVRGSIGADEIPDDLHKKLLRHSSISATERRISYARRLTGNAVHSHFLNAADSIRQLRSRYKINTAQITEEQVIDRRKSSINGLANTVTSKRYGALGTSLMGFVMQSDTSTEPSANADVKSPDVEPDHHRMHMSRLRRFGIVDKTEGDWHLTKRGKDVAKQVAGILASRIPTKSFPSVLSLDAFMADGIPPSLMLALLRSRALGEYDPAQLSDGKTDLYWIRQDLSSKGKKDDTIAMFDALRRNVLDTMGRVSFPPTAAWIEDNMQAKNETPASAFTIKMLLSEMSKDGDGPVRPDGESWEYTVLARVRDLFEREKEKTMSSDMVAMKISMGAARKPEIVLAIKSLERANTVVQIKEGVFTHNSNVESKKDAQRDKELEKAIMDALSTQGEVDDDSMMNILVKFLGDAGMAGDAMDKVERARGVLNRMEEDGRIWLNGSRIVKQGQ